MSNLNNFEEIKKYWNKRPCNVRHSEKPIGTKEYFDEVEKKKYFVEYHIPKFANFPNWRNKKVLEIGCGIGTDAVNFSRNNAEYTGLELSKESLKLTQKRFEVFDLKGTFYEKNAEENLDFLGNNSYDLIYSFGVIHHSLNPDKIVNNVYKLLKDNGTFKLMLYAEHSWKNIMIKNDKDQYEAQSNCPMASTWTNEQVKDLLKNFKNVTIEQKHIFPYKIPEYKKNIYVKHEWFQHMPDELFNILEKNLGWHLCITCQK